MWIVAALLLIVGDALTVLWSLAWMGANPITQQIAPSLEDSERIAAEPGALADFNVLLISMDTTRADHLHAYGHLGVSTPTLDGLAENGVLFSQAITPSPSTLPAHSSLMLGSSWAMRRRRIAAAV